MDALKKLFPLSFNSNLIVGIIVYLVVAIIGGIALFVAGLIPLIGLVVRLVGALLDLYVIAGIIILILVRVGIIQE